jgi:dTDP-4-dehydrorhamnose reductase
MRKKVLLLGSAGMAGQVIKAELLKIADSIELVDIARSDKISKPTILLDVSNFDELRRIINNSNFDFVVNCIGLLNSEAEKNPDKAILINSYLPHFLEKITSDTKTRIIHISTDCVFSGSKGGYIETDFKDGKGCYAQSKALGELNNKKDLTIRTSIIGPDLNQDGIGLFNWIMKQSGEVKGFTNAYWSGVTTIELSKFIIKNILKDNFPSGLIHLTNNYKISKYELLCMIKDIFQLEQLKIIQFEDYIVDKTFINTRKDLSISIPTYNEMLLKMKKWIIKMNQSNK